MNIITATGAGFRSICTLCSSESATIPRKPDCEAAARAGGWITLIVRGRSDIEIETLCPGCSAILAAKLNALRRDKD